MVNDQGSVVFNERQSSRRRKLALYGVLFAIQFCLVIGGMMLVFFSSGSWKLWGGCIVCVLVGSQMVWRFIGIIAPAYAGKLLPYIVATFLALVPFYIFGHGLYQLVAFIIFAAIIGITGFYWFVWGVVTSFQEVFLGKKHEL